MMSIAALGGTLALFATRFRQMFATNAPAQPGSPASMDLQGQQYAAEWSARPALDACNSIILATASCADHLATLAKAIQSGEANYSLYTVARGALEAAGQICYLTEPGLDTLERIRRHMNLELKALQQDTAMINAIIRAAKNDGTLADLPPAIPAEMERHAERAELIRRSGEQFGLVWVPAGRFQQAFMEPAPLRPNPQPAGVMDMIANCADADRPREASSLRRSYQVLSSVAHGYWHGHSLMLARSEHTGNAEIPLTIRVLPGNLASRLICVPVAASAAARRLSAWTGWDAGPLTRAAAIMHVEWRRTAGTSPAGRLAGPSLGAGQRR